MRWAMTALGEELDENMVDGIIKESDKEGTGFINILDFAKLCFGIKEKPKVEEVKGKGGKNAPGKGGKNAPKKK